MFSAKHLQFLIIVITLFSCSEEVKVDKFEDYTEKVFQYKFKEKETIGSGPDKYLMPLNIGKLNDDSFAFIYKNDDSNYLGKYNVESISVSDAILLNKTKQIVFIDSRLNDKNIESIKGSINLPYVYRKNKSNDTSKK